MAGPPSPSKTEISAEIETPEKQVPPPRRAGNKNVAFSVKDVRKFAQRLHKRDEGGGIEQANGARSGDELSSMEDLSSSRDSGKILKAKPLVKLPEKYEALAEFFNCLDSSIRLLRLKGSKTTFSNLSSIIQHLTARRFTQRHLAQLKSIFPEAILIHKVVVHDEATCCLKPELQVFIRPEVAENKNCKGESGYTSLRRMLREKLLDFSKEHPEEDDIPEVVLPHPFDQTFSSISRPSPGSTSLEPTAGNLQGLQLSVSSHMPRSFKRSFSQKTPTYVKKTSLLCELMASTESSSLTRSTFRAPTRENSRLYPLVPSPFLTESKNHEEKLKDGYGSEGLKAIIESSPAKPNLSPRLMTETPELQTEKRYRPSSACDSPPDHDIQPARKKIKQSVRAKLSLTPEKKPKEEDVRIESSGPSVEDDLSFRPDHLLQSVKDKESKALVMKEAGAAEFLERQKIVACLPKTFNLILLLFQSGKCSVMTKRELIHKIISGHLKIVDQSEVEEQLKMLQEIVPDWMWMKTTMNGDSLFCVNKVCDLDEIRRKIANAKC